MMNFGERDLLELATSAGFDEECESSLFWSTGRKLGQGLGHDV